MQKMQKAERPVHLSELFIHGAVAMGRVLVSIRLMPEDVDVDLEKIKEEIKRRIPEGVELRGLREEKIAFGLRAVIADVIVEDAAGASDEVEERFCKIPRVQSVQVVGLSRILE